MPHRQAGRAGRRARDARGHAHRPRLDGRRGRAVPRRRQGGRASRSSAARSTSSRTARAKEPPNQRNWAHLTLLAETTEGYHNLVKLVSDGLPRGLPLQAARRPRAAGALRRRADRAVGLPRSRVNQALLDDDGARARAELDRAGAALRPRRRVRRAAGRRARGAQEGQRGAAAARRRDRACRWSARATCTTCGPRTPTRTRCCSASRPATSSRTRGASGSPTRSSTSRRPTRWRACSRRTARELLRPHAGDRRALQRRRWSSTASACRASTCRRARTPSRTCAGSASRACARRYETVDDDLRDRLGVRAADDPGDGLRRLLPDRLGLRGASPSARASAWARAAARRPARWWPTASASPTSTPSATTCSSSASSTPAASRCPTSTSTSRCTAASA